MITTTNLINIHLYLYHFKCIFHFIFIQRAFQLSSDIPYCNSCTTANVSDITHKLMKPQAACFCQVNALNTLRTLELVSLKWKSLSVARKIVNIIIRCYQVMQTTVQFSAGSNSTLGANNQVI